MALSHTILSPETITAANGAIDRIETLQQAIMSAAQSNPTTIGEDEGVETLFSALRGLGSRFRKVDPEDVDPMPAAVVTLMTEQVIPQLTAVIDKLESLWVDAQAKIAAGESSELLVMEYLEDSEGNSESALYKLQHAYEEVQSAAVSRAFEDLAAALS